MIELNTKRFKSKPFAHQVEGVKALMRHESFALFDEMGAGKSKQVIDAACSLHVADELTAVIIVCPASVRTVWGQPEFGEIKKHAWVPSKVLEFHALYRGSNWRVRWQDTDARLWWVITNYEFLRDQRHTTNLVTALKGPNSKIMLVLDESSYVKSHVTEQSEALRRLREVCSRCVLLNGTPVTDSPLDLWSQLQIMDSDVLRQAGYKNYYHFRARHAVMGGWKMKKVIKWKNLEQLSAAVAPHILRRLKKDCLDLPPKLYTVREVALKPESWKRYQELKRDAVVHLSATDIQLEPNSAVRIMRLAQLTSGQLGGALSVTNIDQQLEPDEMSWAEMKDLSDEKLRWCVDHIMGLTANAVIVWTRFRRERERLVALLRENHDIHHEIIVQEIYGGQSKNGRESAIASFSTVSSGTRRVLVAQPHAGGHGLNLIASSHVVYLSNDYSLGIRLQSEDRCHRTGQINPVTYVDVLATGPTGQRTVDHIILKALREKEEVANWTTSRWRKELEVDDAG